MVYDYSESAMRESELRLSRYGKTIQMGQIRLLARFCFRVTTQLFYVHRTSHVLGRMDEELCRRYIVI